MFSGRPAFSLGVGPSRVAGPPGPGVDPVLPLAFLLYLAFLFFFLPSPFGLFFCIPLYLFYLVFSFTFLLFFLVLL